MTIKNIGIVGYGSIGQKHHKILSSINKKFKFFINTKQKGVNNSFDNIESFSSLDLDYIIISNPTSQHYEALKFLDERYKKIKFLIEKPLFSNLESFNSKSNSYFVGYNLRFHKLIDELRQYIRNKSIISLAIKTYSYLPDWRKNLDYQASASAFKSKGGGVLRDLSHEIDLLNFLFGNAKFFYADSRKISNLDIETDDYLLTCGQLECGAPFNIELNYFSRLNSREIFVETTQESIRVDLTNSKITKIGGTRKFSEYEIDMNSTYKAMHQAIISDNSKKACSIKEALLVLEQIKHIEQLSS